MAGDEFSHLVIGGGGVGTFNQSGGGNFASDLFVTGNSSYKLTGGGLEGGFEFIDGTFTQSGGANSAQAGFAFGAFAFDLTGKYDLSGGSLSGFESVSGTFKQSGGSNTADVLDISNSGVSFP